jgi:hypothetical protein
MAISVLPSLETMPVSGGKRVDGGGLTGAPPGQIGFTAAARHDGAGKATVGIDGVGKGETELCGPGRWREVRKSTRSRCRTRDDIVARAPHGAGTKAVKVRIPSTAKDVE